MAYTKLSEYYDKLGWVGMKTTMDIPNKSNIKVEKIRRNMFKYATNQLIRFGCSSKKCDWSGEFIDLIKEDCENGVVELTYKCPKCSEKKLYIYKRSMFKSSFVEDFMDKLGQLKW